MGPESKMTSVFIKRGHLGTEKHAGRMPLEDGAERGDALQAEEHQTASRSAGLRGAAQFLLTDPQGPSPARTLSQTSGLLGCEDEVALLKVPSLWCLVKAASKLAWGSLQPFLPPLPNANLRGLPRWMVTGLRSQAGIGEGD